MPNPETHSCCTCGHTWKHGHDGSHSCSENLRAALKEIREVYNTDPESFAFIRSSKALGL